MTNRLRVLFLTVLTAQAGLPAGAAPERAFDGAASPEACAALGFRSTPQVEDRRSYGGVRPVGAMMRPAPSYAPPPAPPPPTAMAAPAIPPLPLPPVGRRLEPSKSSV